MRLTMGEAATLLGTSSADPDRVATGYSIDSRTLTAGELFFAIRGPRFDGHDFVAQALSRGAAGAVVEVSFREKADPSLAQSLLGVSNPTQALQRLAREVRRRWGKRLIAVTGSAGKTTTKELIASVLARRYSVLKSPGNLNNYYGVPLALLALEPAHQVAVLELAMSAPGEIALLAQIAEPQVGVVTNVAPVHLEFFDTVDSIARAKRELIDNLISPSTAVLNFDDERVREFVVGFEGQVVTYGFRDGAKFRAIGLHSEVDGGSRFTVRSAGFEKEFRIPLPGRHNVLNALAAIATASLFDIPPEQIEQGLAERSTLHQRSEILTLPSGITVLNDCYNSNPLAMERMLETLANWPGGGRRILVAGEMLELGPLSPEWHRNVGRNCAEGGVDWLLAVQGDARFFVEGAVEAGLPAERAKFFSTPQEAAEAYRGLLQPGDVVLVKGSRGVHLEKVIELLQTSQEPPAGSDGPQRTN
jgi:UDP-N-acetylmuramoyl-tripeptide--D-alanyl-D-alanine ligase